ncbi:hypothetical protein [Pedobacter miscanthi]|uniref:hypothetical protein n=1 Tax=Pedobacter miscanthi TaxID=2259170 RepID=UPI002931C25C|nr:hypothetical protein [Pedobacter miscanthi]
MYRLDRTAFRAQIAKEASKADQIYYKNISWQERLKIANYLNSVAFNYPENDLPIMINFIFSTRSRQ